MCKLLKIILLSIVLIGNNTIKADIKYVSQVCVNDVAGFIYIPTNGKTVNSIYWEFGNGFTSNNINPVHLYTLKGTYTVKANVTFTDNSTLTETCVIEIKGLPIADFKLNRLTDSCTNNNSLCLIDYSVPDNINQSIVKKIITWGDGRTFNTSTPFYGQENCNQYNKADKYKIVVEITDKFGCKNTFKDYITIREGITASFVETINYTSCNSATVCIKNNSTQVGKLKAKYIWQIDSLPTDTNNYLTSSKCIDYKRSKKFQVSLEAQLPNGCKDNTILDINVNLGPLQGNLKLSDSLLCYGSGKRIIKAEINKQNALNVVWSLDNKRLTSNSDSINIFLGDSNLLPGYHTVSCTISRGNCFKTYEKRFRIVGPVASFEVFNFNGCIFPEKKYYFINQSTYNPKTTSFYWDIEDANGDNCITDRSKKQNVSNYCNKAKDSFAIHQYRETVDQSYVTFKITDNSIGCSDEIGKLIINKCSRLCQPGEAEDINICLGDLIFDELEDVKLPYKISFDNGAKWYKYPVKSDSIGEGTFNMTIIFMQAYKRWLVEHPFDSFEIKTGYIELFDTFDVKNKLNVFANRKDTISIAVYGKCSPFMAVLKFNNKHFKTGEIININWGDGNITTLNITKNGTEDSFVHFYNNGQKIFVKAEVTNAAKCVSKAQAFVNFGKSISITYKNNLCANSTNCFSATIYDNITNKLYIPNVAKNEIIWWSSNSAKKDSGLTHCEYFTKGGAYNISLQVKDSNGCVETLTKSFFVNEVIAGIKHHPRDIYCTELTQFFDSSKTVGDSSDYIQNYFWDFGNNQFSVYDKNPSKAFDIADDHIKITHVVISRKGCKDTAQMLVNFKGANVYFTIKDTIACGKLDGVFYNLSKNCSKYIWEYGNDSNSTYNTDSAITAYKTYYKVGKYKVKLRGIQTVFNPFTNNVYFCNSVFPDPEQHRDSSRTVWVLPNYKAKILSRDTICINDTIAFKSNLDSIYKTNHWSVNDSNYLISNAPYTFQYHFQKEGVFQIKLKPEIPNQNQLLKCVDSAFKTVLVVDVKAGFNINDQFIPSIQFINTSTPKFANYNWDFGDNSSFDNTSEEENPSHTFVNLKKEYNVCLIASLKFGCADTVCKPIGPYDNFSSFYNVFTPGKNDGFNDDYDIIIEGEDQYELWIYDRWGILVYHGDRDNDDLQNTNWNGRLHNTGPECTGGTYYYIFNYTMKIKPDEKKTHSGVITLIR